MSGAQSPDREDFNDQMLLQSERSASLRTKESQAHIPGKRKAVAVQTGTELLVGLRSPVDSRSTATQTEVDKMELMEKELEELAKQSRQMYGLYGSKVELNRSGDIFFKGRGDFSATAKPSKDGYKKAPGVVYDEGPWVQKSPATAKTSRNYQNAELSHMLQENVVVKHFHGGGNVRAYATEGERLKNKLNKDDSLLTISLTRT